MASASDLRAFATYKFYERGLGRFLADERRHIFDIQMLTAIFPENEGAQDLKRNDLLLDSVAHWIEVMQWYALGAQLGYFDKKQAVAPPELVSEVAGGEAASTWAPAFRSIAHQYVDKEPVPPEINELPFEDSTALAVFQSAMIAAEQFRDPLMVNLTRYLNSSMAPGKLAAVEAQDVFSALKYEGLVPRSPSGSPEFLIAGMLRLIDTLNTMQAIFPAEIAATNEHPGRSVIGRRVMQLLSWRVDQWHPGKAEKLKHLLVVLWDCCGREAQKYAADFILDTAETDEDFRTQLQAWHTWTKTEARSFMAKSELKIRLKMPAINETPGEATTME